MTGSAGRRSGGRATVVALAVGALAVVLAAAGWWQQRPDDAGRTAVEVAAVDADGGAARAAPSEPPAPSDLSASPAPSASSAPSASPEPSAAAEPPAPPQPPASPPAPAAGRRDAGVVAAPAATAPVMLEVPALGVRTEVDQVGVQPDGSMTVPADPDRVGWYRFGPAPGASQGSAVLAGHVDTARDGPGAFAALSGIEVGQDVLVTLADGTVVTYRVEGRQGIVKQELPVDVLFARDGPARLTLITCGGPFQPELRSYRDNLVVTAVPVAP